ncbi:MAG: pyridoxamine 5'-phosphate oxidase family protein, partial [Clostridia bacterium]|nr:pyridoxamine 5'-phosphate oxidase family protein [Clostridia bacterium]
MRRRDREITDAREIARIMGLCQSVSVAFAGETPYVVPVNFGFAIEDGAFCLYIHGASEGEKMRRMALDPRAAFAMHTAETLIEAQSACGYTMDFLSVCGSGTLETLSGEEKRRGLMRIMDHYAPGRTFA